MPTQEGNYIVTEYEWLVSNGVHPLLAANQLNRKPFTLTKMLYRYGRVELARRLDSEASKGTGK